MHVHFRSCLPRGVPAILGQYSLNGGSGSYSRSENVLCQLQSAPASRCVGAVGQCQCALPAIVGHAWKRHKLPLRTEAALFIESIVDISNASALPTPVGMDLWTTYEVWGRAWLSPTSGSESLHPLILARFVSNVLAGIASLLQLGYVLLRAVKARKLMAPFEFTLPAIGLITMQFGVLACTARETAPEPTVRLVSIERLTKAAGC